MAVLGNLEQVNFFRMDDIFSVGVVRIVRDHPVNSFGKSSSAHSRGWYVPQSRDIMHNANDSLRCCNVKLCVSMKFQPYVKKPMKKQFFFRNPLFKRLYMNPGIVLDLYTLFYRLIYNFRNNQYDRIG